VIIIAGLAIGQDNLGPDQPAQGIADINLLCGEQIIPAQHCFGGAACVEQFLAQHTR
jgi:hypothetical protein